MKQLTFTLKSFSFEFTQDDRFRGWWEQTSAHSPKKQNELSLTRRQWGEDLVGLIISHPLACSGVKFKYRAVGTSKTEDLVLYWKGEMDIDCRASLTVMQILCWTSKKADVISACNDSILFFSLMRHRYCFSFWVGGVSEYTNLVSCGQLSPLNHTDVLTSLLCYFIENIQAPSPTDKYTSTETSENGELRKGPHVAAWIILYLICPRNPLPGNKGIRGSQRVCAHDFGDPLIFHLALPKNFVVLTGGLHSHTDVWI